MDDRPRLAEVFRRLREGEGPLWVRWDGRRLLVRLPDAQWLARGEGGAIVATRRGYRRVVLAGRNADGGFLRSKRGAPKNQPFRAGGDHFNPINEKRIRAVIVEDHDG